MSSDFGGAGLELVAAIGTKILPFDGVASRRMYYPFQIKRLMNLVQDLYITFLNISAGIKSKEQHKGWIIQAKTSAAYRTSKSIYLSYATFD